MGTRWRTSIVIGAAVLAYGPSAAAELPSELGWSELPDTKIDDVCACTGGFPEVCAISGCAAITSAWNSAVLDTMRNRLVIWGGGHADYYGNELYALDLDALTMQRLNDPGLPLALCSESTANGTQAASRHTNDGIAYLAHADKMFVYGGALACDAGGLWADTWTYDFATETWTQHSPSGPAPGAELVISAYDPGGERVLLHTQGALYSYRLEADAFELHSNAGVDWHATGVIDPQREHFWIFGSGQAFRYDISAGGDYAQEAVTTAGDQSVVQRHMPGVAYDPMTDTIVGWADGDNVYSLDLDALEWTTHEATGGPQALDNGTWKRWSYVPTDNAFISVNATSLNAFSYKLTPGGGVDPTTDTGDESAGEETGTNTSGGDSDSSPGEGDPSGDEGPSGTAADADGGSGGSGSGVDNDEGDGCSCRNGTARAPLLLIVLAFVRRRG